MRAAYLDTTREQMELNDNVKLHLFGRVTCESGWSGDSHAHDFWELVYIEKTNADPFRIQWSDGEHISESVSIYLMPPGTPHQFENIGTIEAQNVYVGFSFSYPFHSDVSQLPVVLPVDNAAIAGMVALFHELTQPMSNDELYAALNARRPELMRRLMDVVKWICERGTGGDVVDRNQMLIDKIKDYIMDNLDRYIIVDEISRQLYLSPNYLGQVFRQNTGTTVKNYHNQMRMERALNHLVSGTATISEVADRMGFESVAYFSRRFKMFYGISPSSIQRNRIADFGDELD